jgi:uncharacterized membrane protein YeaQ/YmgE (transglycosylase-associated protein family)
MTIEGILGAIIIGAVIGIVGRLVVPGRQNIPIWLTILVGIGAALLGSLIVGNDLRNTDGVDWIELLAQVGLAAVGVAAVSAMRSGGRSRNRVGRS